MKILMTTDTTAGVWTYALQLAAELHESGIEVALATMGEAPTAQQRREAHAIGSLGLFESTYKLEWMNDPWEDLCEAGDWLTYLEDVVQPDVIHLNSYAHAARPFKAPVLVVAHPCVLSREQTGKDMSHPAGGQRYVSAVSNGIAAADILVAPTRARLHAVIGQYGRPARTLVIPHGRAPFTHGLRPKWPFIFGAGRFWNEARNLARLERLAPRLDWPVYLAGEAASPASLPDRRRRKVNLLGHLPFAELAKWLDRTAIYILPTRHEPFGLSVLEAGLCGCALVLGDIESFRETWGSAAIYVPPDDDECLVTTLQELIANPDKLRHYGTSAHQRAATFSARRMADAYIAAYEKLLSRRSRRGTRQEELTCTS
jgi:glycosyltransferase involved in cell wall biosynthesis